MEPSPLDTSDPSSQSESSVASSTSESDPSTESEQSDLEGESAQRDRQSRPKWKHVWSSADNTGRSYADVKQSLPTHATAKNDPYDCTMPHALVGHYELAHTDHKMRTVMTRCTSTRCESSGVKCACRYEINMCQSSDYVSIVQEGEHTMLDTDRDSPRVTRGLTDEAKALVHEILLQNPGVAPHVVFTHLSTVLPGRAPFETQVQGYLKRWRSKNKDDSMKPVIDICASSMFELMENMDQTADKLLVFCDSRLEEGSLVPDLGDASDESPFRIGLTCFALLENYINVQEDPRCTTILHVDSTHNMVKMKYNVFILGISDSCGHFFPVVYYCASQRRAEDVAWCLAYLKRVTMQLFAVRFAPAFVMTDADKAQYKACADELPSTKILMCWFHLCQHAWKVAKRLPKAKREVIFHDLNDLHFCRTQSEFDTKKEHVIAKWTTLGRSCPGFRSKSKKLIRQWLNNPRLSNWQAFHTPPGYPTTNNPVEQYHRTLKLENTRHAMPIDMVHLLDRSRIGFLAKKTKFSSITEASRRLKAHYNKIKRQGQLCATALLPVGTQSQRLVVVRHIPLTVEAQTAANVSA